MIDSFNITPLGEYSGSINDLVWHRGFLETTSSFNRQVIASKASRNITSKFGQKNLVYSQRLRIISGSHGGSRLQNFSFQFSSEGESYFDSYLPTPVDITLANGFEFAFLEGSGNLPADSKHEIPPANADAISIFLGIPGDIPSNLTNVADAKWPMAPWPFQTKYKNLARFFTPSIKLPKDFKQTREYSTGNSLSGTEKSNKLGSLYIATGGTIDISMPEIQAGESTGTNIDFDHQTFPGVGQETGFGLNKVALSKTFLLDGEYYVAVGDRDRFGKPMVIVSNNGANWTAASPITTGSTALPAGTVDAKSIDKGIRNSLFGDIIDFWIMVGTHGSILTTDDATPDINSTWKVQTPTGGFADTFSDVVWTDPEGDRGAGNRKAVIVGANGEVQISGDFDVTTWSNPSSPPGLGVFFQGIDIFAIDTVAHTLVIVGNGGALFTSGDNGDTWTNRSSGTSNSLFAVACRKSNNSSASQTAIAVGANGTIVRSTNLGVDWATISPAGGYTGTFRSVAQGGGLVDQSTDDNIDWIIVGDNGEIQFSTDDGATWQQEDPNPSTISENFNGVVAVDMNANDSNKVEPGSNYVVVGEPDAVSRDKIYRIADLTTNGYFTPSGSNIPINDAAKIVPGGFKTLGTNVRSSFNDFYRAYFGIGNGFFVNLESINPTNLSNPRISEFRNRSVNFADFAVFDPGTELGNVEAIRLYAPQPRGFGYGVLNVIPQKTKAHFRRDRYGHFRDMLEQRLYSKFFNSITQEGKSIGSLAAAVNINFISGSAAAVTASNPLLLNPTDSGIYDFEYKAGRPFDDTV